MTLTRSALSRVASAHLRSNAIRTSTRLYAAVAASSTSEFRGPPVTAMESKSTMVKYAGKGKAITPGVRHAIAVHHPHLHPGSSFKPLTVPLRRSGGRNDSGQVVNRFVGGGHKRRLRVVDFMREEPGECEVVRIEYDPGRSAHIALVKKKGAKGTADEGAEMAERTVEDIPEAPKAGAIFNPHAQILQSMTARSKKELPKVRGGWSYIVAPEGLRAGDTVRSFRSGIPAGIVPGYSGSHSTSRSRDHAHNALSTSPGSPQTVLPPAMNDSASARALGLLRTLTLRPGNVLPLHLCPPGTVVHNISLSPTGKMQLCRSAGTSATIVAHHIGRNLDKTEGQALVADRARESSDRALEGVAELGAEDQGEGLSNGKGWALVKLRSGEVRKLHPDCVATIGMVSNREHSLEQIGKAGRNRWLGIKPRVRGVAMNACDHPHGGGRGKSKGNKDPRSVWGWLTKKRTRRPKDRDGNKMVVTERPRSVGRVKQ